MTTIPKPASEHTAAEWPRFMDEIDATGPSWLWLGDLARAAHERDPGPGVRIKSFTIGADGRMETVWDAGKLTHFFFVLRDDRNFTVLVRSDAIRTASVVVDRQPAVPRYRQGTPHPTGLPVVICNSCNEWDTSSEYIKHKPDCGQPQPAMPVSVEELYKFIYGSRYAPGEENDRGLAEDILAQFDVVRKVAG